MKYPYSRVEEGTHRKFNFQKEKKHGIKMNKEQLQREKGNSYARFF